MFQPTLTITFSSSLFNYLDITTSGFIDDTTADLIRNHFILNSTNYTGNAVVGSTYVTIIVEPSQEIILTDINGNTYSKRYTNRAGQVKSDDYVNVIAKEYIKEVFLGDGITRIGSQAFNSCIALTKWRIARGLGPLARRSPPCRQGVRCYDRPRVDSRSVRDGLRS